MKNNLKRLHDILAQTLLLAENQDLADPELAFGQTPGWDSIAQLQIIARIEKAFHQKTTPEEILTLDSYHKLTSWLKKRGVDLSS